MKKTLAWILAAVLLIALGSTAFADTSYTIVIDNAVKGETYSAYKVFDVTYDGTNAGYTPPSAETDIPGDPDTGHQHTAYSYTISSGSTFWTDLTTNDATNNPVTLADGVYTLSNFGLKFVPTTVSGVYNVVPSNETTGVTSAHAQALAAFLGTKLTGKSAAASATANAETNTHDGYATGSLTLDVTTAGPGYYFVDTTTGSLCSLDTTEPSATIREKNSLPTDDKKVSDAADGTFGDETTVKIGDTVYFKIEVTDSKGTDKKIVVHDTMNSALTLDLGSFAVKVGGSVVPTSNYTIRYSSTATTSGTAAGNMSSAALADGCTFEIEFTDAYIQSLAENSVIVITYSAELNGNAVTATPFQTNKSNISYSNQSTVENEVTVKTYEVDVVKTDDQNALLDGATFNLYDAATGGNKYDLVKVSDGVYRLACSADAAASYAEKLIPKDGKLTIVGLENGTYYLEEVDHPGGYNPLTERVSFAVSDANNSATITGTTYTSGGVQVINHSGSELPSTGGIGTTLFYVIGGLLVAGAVVVLVSKKRVE